MFSLIRGPATSRAMRSASSAVRNSSTRIRCLSSTWATAHRVTQAEMVDNDVHEPDAIARRASLPW